jgi:hypothetical protein
MKTVKAKTVNAFTYREGFGKMSVVDTTPDAERPKYKPLFFSPRQYGTNEEIEINIDDNNFAIYKAPEPIIKQQRRKRR